MDENRREEVGAMRLRKKKSLMDQAREQASDLATDWNQVVRPQLESAVASAREKAGPVIAEAREKAAPVLAEALDRAVAGLSEARDKAGPALADAREKAGPALADARAKAGPIYASGAALAGEKAAAARDLANAKVAELKGDPAPKKKGGKLKKIAFFAAVATAVGFVARKLQAGGQSSDNWQSSYVPAPAPSPASAPGPAAAAPHEPDDAAGSSPDEAIADHSEAPHPVTTPDDPAEVVQIDEK
jgi:vacuolar-type H+-ATPase subunit H